VSGRGRHNPNLEGIAIVGMAGRFPGAATVAEFWKNQLAGIESISHFRVEELEVQGAAELARNPNYVKARSVIDGADLFDADFFGIYPREAELMDPQQRIFLECCWQALEDGGYDPGAYAGAIGVYAGSSTSTYFLSRLCSKPGFIEGFTGGYQVGNYAEMMGNNLDFLATRVAYKLNLRGPAFTMQAGCSTSLLATTQACQALLTYQCDMALAGGSSITFPQKRGSYYQDGGMISPDGHCRAFDANAQGTVFGGGVGVVLLKRCDEAVRDGDQIYAVIRGFAANNDGAAKVGYTAPSVEGQARVIALAQAAAGIEAETIGYIEAHGTGTPLGDPVELAALTQAFGSQTKRKNFCAIGTAKTNVGHLDVAAGVTGLIHATHVVRHGKMPATLHYTAPNPKFDLANSPFYVNASLSEWPAQDGPRRAGVSAFGVGGTNAHVVLEEAPEIDAVTKSNRMQLLVLSARSDEALDQATENITKYLRSNSDANLADVAWTLQAGRRAFPCRRAVVTKDASDAIEALTKRDRKRMQTRLKPKDNPRVCFLFPGQGSQHANMAREIYESEPVFRANLDRCAEILQPFLQADLRTLLYPPAGASEEDKRRVTDTIIAQPAIFSVEYALAQLWMSWGVRPATMLGHSVGEFVAACLAEVFSLEDALALVAERGRMMQEIPAGGMLSVRLPEAELGKRLNGKLSLAAVNSPRLCVVAGPLEALETFEQRLTAEGVACRRLTTSHAFHSSMMDPLVRPFTKRVAQVQLKAPKIPYVSGVTGNWIGAEEATDPGYWARHFRQPVQFSRGVTELRKNLENILLEVGPGNVLGMLTREHGRSPDSVVVSSLSDGYAGEGDAAALAGALGSLWLAGVQPDWKAVHAGETPRRVSLPTYPFERKRFWIETRPVEKAGTTGASVHVNTNTNANVQPVKMVAEKSLEMNQPVNPQTLVQTTLPKPQSRVSEIQRVLADIFEDLSGKEIAAADPGTTFLEMGFDSLFLTQVTQALQSKFDLKITFRQLLGDQSTLDDLTKYIDEKLPAGAFAPAAPAEPMTTTDAGTTAPAEKPSSPLAGTVLADQTTGEVAPRSVVERLMREQLAAMNQLFAQQLAALQGKAATPAGATIPASAATSATNLVPPRSDAPTNEAAPKRGSGSAVPPAEKGAKELKGYTPFKPLMKGASGELTERQKKHIQELVERYTKRTAGSKQKTQEYRGVLADPRVVTGFRTEWKEMIYPIITERSKGSKLWDIDGNEYIDILNGFGPIMLGHRPEFVQEALAKQIEEGFEIGPQTLLAGEVAEMICEFTGNDRATFCNTGSEAVIAAMRVARTVTGRSRVVFFAGDYHGMFDEVLVKGFTKAGVPHSIPSAPGIPRESVSNITVLEYGTTESLEWIRANASSLAAVMVEPVQSRHPNLQPVEFLRELRRITQDAGACLIFDEVVTGFRVHPGGCQALFDIRADLATYGKVLAGGMPIGVLAGKRQFMDALDGGIWRFGDESYPEVGVTFFAGTFVRHPLTMAATKAVLEYFKQQGPGLQKRLSERTGKMVRQLNEMLERNHVPTHIETFASIFYFSFPSDYRFGSLFYYHLRTKGIHLLEGFPCFLTTTHTDADIERIVRAFEETIEEMRQGDMLPQLGETQTPVAQSVGAGEQPVRVGASAASVKSGAEEAVAKEAPVTESQLEVWLSDQISEEASCSYNESFTLRLRGRLNEDALRQALKQVVKRHDALRARFDSEGKMQHFEAAPDLEMPLIDLSALDETQKRARVQSIIDEEARKPFKLEEGRLVRAQLVRTAPEDHQLIFTSHHIVCDGWSTNVLLDEMAKLYNVLDGGVACELQAALSFAAYAKSQQEFFASEEGGENERYWVEQFREPVVPLDLPTDYIRPAMKEFKGATYRKKIDGETLERIKKFGAKQKCTLFVTLLAGLQALLARLSGQDDIVVGIPSAGQSLVEDGVLVGHCVNFLPLRAKIGAGQTTGSFMAEVRQNLFAAYEHQNYTYGRLVRKLNIQRDPGRLPLTEIQFNLERIGGGVQFEGLEAEVDPNPKAFVNFDIFVNAVEVKDGLVLDCDYNTGLYNESTIARWLTHYETLLESMVADASVEVSKLGLLTESELRLLTQRWNDTALSFPRNLTVHKFIATQAKETPQATAVVFEDRQLTYAELDSRSNQMAHYLRNLGVKPGERVAVFVERSLEMIIGLLGTMKSGAAYVPLDPTFPPDRLRFVLEDAKATLVLTQDHLMKSWSFGDTPVVRLDADWPTIAKQTANTPPEVVSPEDLVYVLYTSGSTGKPKGVEIPHRAVVNLLQAMMLRPGLKKSDTLAAITTLSFDISGLELYLPLCAGAKLAIVSRETGSFGVRLLEYLQKVNATVMQATPVTWKLLVDAGWDGGNPPLKVLCGGEAFPRELANQLSKRSISVWNMYGPTETTIWSATGEVESGEGPVPLGQPIANTQFYVLDKEQQLVPIGVPGELYIAGAGLARGYLNQPELTATRFIVNPFNKEPGSRMYRTGDVVMRHPNGDLEFLGRSDDQIKLRGFRIELGEIQSVLASFPGIKETVVVLRRDAPNEERLVAYMVLDGTKQTPSTSELRAFLLPKLPDYMVPAAFVRLEALPLTPNGKIDRRALPAPDWSGQNRTARYVAPRNADEQLMARIWAEVLRLEQVGVNDNLFELGADSLHVFQIAARANKAGIAVTPRQILQFRSIASILGQLSSSEAPKTQAPAITPVSREKYRVIRKNPSPVETKG
jgi:amino acid adenylation domain-containing protein